VIQAEQVWRVVEPVDLRIRIDGLSLRIQNLLGRSPCDGTAYAFRNRSNHRIKRLCWDGTGLWLCARRLPQGRLTWPSSDDATFTLTGPQWQWLTCGIDWRRRQAKPRIEWRVQPHGNWRKALCLQGFKSVSW